MSAFYFREQRLSEANLKTRRGQSRPIVYAQHKSAPGSRGARASGTQVSLTQRRQDNFSVIMSAGLAESFVFKPVAAELEGSAIL